MGVEQSSSAAASVRRWVDRLPARAFFDSRDVPGPVRAVESALSRMVAAGQLMRVRKGSYWKPPETRFGRRVRPRPLDVAMHVAGPGAGPAGVSAARIFGLTTQVPSVEAVSVAGRAPAAVKGVRFSSRSYSRREHELNPYEVALLEVLRSFHLVSERPWSDLVDAVGQAIDEGHLRPERLAAAVVDEPSRAVRERWRELANALHLSVAA